MNNKEFIESITLEGEIWRDVIGYEGLYMVSSYGRCVSLGRIILDTNNISKSIEPKLISFTMQPNGYLQYRLWFENKQNQIIYKLSTRYTIQYFSACIMLFINVLLNITEYIWIIVY